MTAWCAHKYIRSQANPFADLFHLCSCFLACFTSPYSRYFGGAAHTALSKACGVRWPHFGDFRLKIAERRINLLMQSSTLYAIKYIGLRAR